MENFMRQRKGEKAAGFSLTLFSPPKISLTCATSKYQLETLSTKSNLHLPPPTPLSRPIANKTCFADLPLYGTVVCTNKLQTSLRDCNIYGAVVRGNQELAHFSSKNIDYSDFTLNPNTSFNVPFYFVAPHRNQSNQNPEQKDHLTINSTFYFKNNETNQKMQVALSETIEIIDSFTIKQQISMPSHQSIRYPIVQITLTNNFSCLAHKVMLKTIDTTKSFHLNPAYRKNIASLLDNNDGIEINQYKVADLVGINETAGTYIIATQPFSAMEISFSIPFYKTCCFRELLYGSINLFKYSKSIEQHRSNESRLDPNQTQNIVSSRSIISFLASPGTSFLPVPPVTAALGKIPKAVQALWPFSISISITNTAPSNNLIDFDTQSSKSALNGIINLKENESIFLYDYNDLNITDLQPGKSIVIKINIIALKQGKFAFPSFVLAFQKYRAIEVNFDKGIIVIGSKE